MRPLIHTGIIAAITVIMISCGNPDKMNPKQKNEDKERIYPVKIQQIRKRTVSRTYEYTANLTAFKEIHYVPASPGRIDKIYVEIGSRVSKGQLLVQMDRTQLKQAVTQYENAKSTFRRIDTLYQLGSISEQQYEQAKTQYELAKSNVEFLRENTTLVSPINGIITGKYFENGEFYSGTPNTRAGKAAIISLMQINPLKAEVSISQSFFPDIQQGMKASVATDIYPEEVFKGTIYKIHPTIDPATRTFQVEILVENPKEILRPGMFASIELQFGDTEGLIVPANAVLKQEGTNNRYVFVNDNGKVKQIDVKIGKRFDDQVELIAKGLYEGTEIIVEGQASLINGSKIKVIK